jgi:hypothetical protein
MSNVLKKKKIMKILICSIALICNLIALNLHSNIKTWAPHSNHLFIRTNFSLRFFIVLSLIIGVIATSDLTALTWYWNIPIYLIGLFIGTLVCDMITGNSTKFHMFLSVENRACSVCIWSLTVLSFILAIYGYNL